MKKKAPAKDPRGRKPRSGVPGKPFSLKLTPDERSSFEAAAEQDGESLTEWIRNACGERLRKARKRE